MIDFFFIKTKIAELEQIKGSATELLSVYMTKKESKQDILLYLKKELTESRNIKAKVNRKRVLSNLEQLMNYIKKTDLESTQNFFFCCSSRDILGHLPLPETESFSFNYTCSSSFELNQLKKISLNSKKNFLLLVEKNEATFGQVEGTAIKLIKTFSSYIPGKHRAGGQSAVRYSRVIFLATMDFLKEISTFVNEFLKTEKYDFLFLGGPGFLKQKLYEGAFLFTEIKKKIYGLYSTTYCGLQGLKELSEKSFLVLKENALFKLKESLKKAFLEKRRLPLEDLLPNLKKNKIKTICILESCKQILFEQECTFCETKERTFLKKSTCSQCNSSLSTSVLPLVEFLKKNYDKTNNFALIWIQEDKITSEISQLLSLGGIVICV